MLSNYSLDTFVAPELSKLTFCGAQELPPREGEWLSRFALDTIFRNRDEAPHKTLSIAYLRKVEAALDEYEVARSSLLGYLDGARKTSMYFRALRHFENCLAMAYQAMEVVQAMGDGSKFFEKGDNSLLERINKLYNDGKHIAGALSRGNYPDIQATLVIWLANDQIKSKECGVTYLELREFLMELAKWAEVAVTRKLLEDAATAS